MRFRSVAWSGLIFLVSLVGCVSTSQYKDVKNDFHVVQQELKDGQKKMDELRYALRNAREDTDHCRRAQTRLQDKIKISETEKQKASKQIEELNHTINKQATIISIQEAVIRMLDDPQQTIQTSIKEQIAAQNSETSPSSPSKKMVRQVSIKPAEKKLEE